MGSESQKFYWEAVSERALRTWAQAALAAIVVTGATDFGGVPWMNVLSTASFAALISVLMSLAASRDGNPSWGSIERVRGTNEERVENRPLPGRGGGVDEDSVPERGDG